MLVLARTETTSDVNFAESEAHWRPVRGAVMVGALLSAAAGCALRTPRDEKLARPPSFVPAATPITQGALAYGFMVSLPGPEFPAANTTTMFRSCACLLAMLMGSLGSNAPVPPQEFEMMRTL